VAVFGSADRATGTERLVVLAEARDARGAGNAALRDAVSRAVIDAIGEPADEIVLAPAHSVLKTSSGKVRRSACRERYEAGTIGTATRPALRQLLRLALGALAPRARALARSAVDFTYGPWALLVFCALAPATWLASVALRSPERAWRVSHRAARALLRFTATPLAVRGTELLPAGPCVLVINHASYLDGIVLAAALARPFVFVAKQELQSQFFAGRYLRSLGTAFVERVDAKRSVEDAERIAGLVQQGHSLAMFPEGTFVKQPGLLPFHLGAFLAAARAGVPVVPVAIGGTRRLLGAGRWWPRRTALSVEIGEPIVADVEVSDGFARAARLREAAWRSLARCTEGA
jgi:1-acyl-sn-glycerol-3-phosphate acyltransferase